MARLLEYQLQLENYLWHLGFALFFFFFKAIHVT